LIYNITTSLSLKTNEQFEFMYVLLTFNKFR